MIPSPPTSPGAGSPALLNTRILTILLLLLSVLEPVFANSLPIPLPTLQPASPPDHHPHHNINRREEQQQQQQQQQPPGPYTPLVTPAPSAVPDAVVLQGQGFRQETYYTCITAPSGNEHCGWHTPLLRLPDKQGSAAAVVAAPGGRRATDTRVVVAVVAALAGLFAVGMM